MKKAVRTGEDNESETSIYCINDFGWARLDEADTRGIRGRTKEVRYTCVVVFHSSCFAEERFSKDEPQKLSIRPHRSSAECYSALCHSCSPSSLRLSAVRHRSICPHLSTPSVRTSPLCLFTSVNSVCSYQSTKVALQSPCLTKTN